MAAETDKTDGPVKVVDRRWWVHGETGAEPSAPRKPSYIEELERQLAEKDKAIQAHAARYRESAAEFDQVRARLRRDVDKEVDRARRALLLDFLDVADNLDRAIAAARGVAGTDAALLKGVELVRDLFLAKLAGYGVTPVVTEGQLFDPRVHEAVSMVPVAEASRDEVVVGEVRKGYRIGEEVLRPAGVVVGKLGGSV
jgi:molecular chaperone GrpE